jgi:hypothetical protein
MVDAYVHNFGKHTVSTQHIVHIMLLLGLHFITNMNQILSPHQVELYTSLNELPILDETNHHLVSPQHITIFLQLIP